jgi:hypothetical protein
VWQEIPCVRNYGATAYVLENGYVMFYKPGAKEAHAKRYMLHPPQRPWFCEDCTSWGEVETLIESLPYTRARSHSEMSATETREENQHEILEGLVRQAA